MSDKEIVRDALQYGMSAKVRADSRAALSRILADRDSLRTERDEAVEYNTGLRAENERLREDVADLQAKLYEAYGKKRKWKHHFDAARRQMLDPRIQEGKG